MSERRPQQGDCAPRPAEEAIVKIARRPAAVFMAVVLIMAGWWPAAPADAQDDFGGVPAGPGLALFYAGDFAGAAKALAPLARTGDVEALVVSLIMRRNGLDGQLPEASLGGYAAVLAVRGPALGEALKAGNLTGHQRGAYLYALAHLNYFGAGGFTPNPGRAKLLASQAALAGFTPALNFLTFMADQGQIGLNPLGGARQAAGRGDRLAMANLSLFYREGRHVERNDLRAAHWARQACEAKPGFARAQNEVGFFYQTGRGVTQDSDEARRWYKMAADQGYAPALANLDNLTKKNGRPPQVDGSINY